MLPNGANPKLPTGHWAPKSLPLFTDRLPLTTLLTELPTDARASPYIYDLADLSKLWVSIIYFLQCKVTALKS